MKLFLWKIVAVFLLVTIFLCSCGTKDGIGSVQNTESNYIIVDSVTPLDNLEPSYTGDATLYKGVFLSSVHGSGKHDTNGCVSHGFIQLYNSTDENISLKGSSIYYASKGITPFLEFVFPEDAVIPARGYYLIRTNAPKGISKDDLVISIENFDVHWNVTLDDSVLSLIHAPSDWCVEPGIDPLSIENTISVFVSKDTDDRSVYSVTDMDSKHIAVRTALNDYSGYHLVDISRCATQEIEQVSPVNSASESNPVLSSRINEVLFSHHAGIYDEPFVLSLSAPEGYKIYYTTDGKDPTDKSIEYSEGIHLNDTSARAWGLLTRTLSAAIGRNAWPIVDKQPGCYVIKAMATNGTDTTPVFTKTFFIGSVFSDYNITMMSFSADRSTIIGSDGFYNNLEAFDGKTRKRGTGTMEVFSADGTRVGNSIVEMAVSGHGSSVFGMKSLRVYYKGYQNEEGGLDSTLNYDLFKGYARDNLGQAITEFSRFSLRNSGNDTRFSYIKDAFMQRSSDELYADTLASSAVLLFLNGEFWGVYNARERYCPEYVESHYGVNKDNVCVLENGGASSPYILSSGDPDGVKHFNDLYRYIIRNDLSKPDVYEYVCSQIDINSFIDMWVARIFYNATDWPQNNVKLWRNMDPNDPSGMDTKWHFTLSDMDYGIFRSHKSVVTESSFSCIDSKSICGYIMKYFLRNPDFKKLFISRFYDVCKRVYETERLVPVLDVFVEEKAPFMKMQEGRWAGDEFSADKWDYYVDLIYSYIKVRKHFVFKQLYDYFDITEDDVLNMMKEINYTY